LLLCSPGHHCSQQQKLQASTFYGQEKKPLAYVIGLMNMILHA